MSPIGGRLALFVRGKQHFWIEKHSLSEKKVLNPVISLNKTGNIVHSILKHAEVVLPIKKIILSRNSYIDYPEVPYDIELIDIRKYDEWFMKMRRTAAPIKHTQIIAAKALLNYCLTISCNRTD
ncbi:hypothetical protein [Metabacillus arenae]|uniref:Uncharacterized protein n=1 Tax=Metabacillus arenae TaxID=2771434 RepID=A0A926NER7_9BACI|nr:hypothetical protein [Metabacillus arenae]MBD1380184.1 hypothetical protein [Metabacillus arenae]